MYTTDKAFNARGDWKQFKAAMPPCIEFRTDKIKKNNYLTGVTFINVIDPKPFVCEDYRDVVKAFDGKDVRWRAMCDAVGQGAGSSLINLCFKNIDTDKRFSVYYNQAQSAVSVVELSKPVGEPSTAAARPLDLSTLDLSPSDNDLIIQFKNRLLKSKSDISGAGALAILCDTYSSKYAAKVLEAMFYAHSSSLRRVITDIYGDDIMMLASDRAHFDAAYERCIAARADLWGGANYEGMFLHALASLQRDIVAKYLEGYALTMRMEMVDKATLDEEYDAMITEKRPFGCFSPSHQ